MTAWEAILLVPVVDSKIEKKRRIKRNENNVRAIGPFVSVFATYNLFVETRFSTFHFLKHRFFYFRPKTFSVGYKTSSNIYLV